MTTRCCVIGGSGFIGLEVIRQLQASGRKITVIGRNPQSTSLLPEGVFYRCGDYGNVIFLRSVIADVDEIIDLAYSTVPKTSFDNPLLDIETNLPQAVNLLQLASEFPIKKMVIASSGGTVYGKAQFLPITENHPTQPVSPYGITKLAIEKYAFMYHQLLKLNVVCVRPGNAYGENQKPFRGQGFIATAIASIQQNKPVIIFGEMGTIRDYIHVSDLAAGILAALDNGIPGDCYNIGTGIGSSNREILELIIPLANKEGITPQIDYLPERSFDVSANILDSSKLQKQSDWKPTIRIEQSLPKIWEFMKYYSRK